MQVRNQLCAQHLQQQLKHYLQLPPPHSPKAQTLNFQVTPPHLTSQLPTVPPDRLNSAGC